MSPFGGSRSSAEVSWGAHAHGILQALRASQNASRVGWIIEWALVALIWILPSVSQIGSIVGRIVALCAVFPHCEWGGGSSNSKFGWMTCCTVNKWTFCLQGVKRIPLLAKFFQAMGKWGLEGPYTFSVQNDSFVFSIFQQFLIWIFTAFVCCLKFPSLGKISQEKAWFLSGIARMGFS